MQLGLSSSSFSAVEAQADWGSAPPGMQTMQALQRPVPTLGPSLGPPLGPPPLHGVTATLQNKELWNKFHEVGTEMIITKLGRRMFPALRLRLSGLEPDARYFVVLELRLSAPSRFKFSGGRWVSAGIADTQSVAAARLHVHADSPATGAAWSSREVSFHRAKLTNNSLDRAGNMMLTSMHKYMPRIHVVRTSDVLALHCSPTATFSFPETEFIAVTAYQNDRITKMKIDNNPFAKGFRETGMSRCKRKQLAEERTPGAPGDPELLSLPLLPPKRSCSVSSHDDSGVSSLGSATPPASPSTTPPLSPPPSTPTPPVAAAPKCSLSIERLLAKDDFPKRARASTSMSYRPEMPCCPLPVPYPVYPSTWMDPLYFHVLQYSPYGYSHPHPQPYSTPALYPTPLVPGPFPMELSRPFDTSSWDEPRDLSVKRES